MKKIYRFKLLALFTVCILFAGSISLWAQFAGGSGTEEDPWQIVTATHLDSIRIYLGEEHNNKYFIQLEDINFGGTAWHEGEGWLPIGTEENQFWGFYNGNEKIIDSLYINRPEGEYQALFGVINGGTITDLGLTNAEIIANSYVGTLGGLAEGANIVNSYATGSIKGTSTLGGLISYSDRSSTLSSCYAEVDIEGVTRVGGLVAYNRRSSMITNCYSRGDALGETYVGGLVGTNVADVEKSYSTGLVQGDSYPGGLIGQNSGDVTSCFWDMDTSEIENSAGGEGRTTDQMTYPYAGGTFTNWDFNQFWMHDSNGNTNNGYPFLRSRISSKPFVASDPDPEDGEVDVAVGLLSVGWSYVGSLFYATPLGFKVYMNTTGEFTGDDDFEWVAYVQNQVNYLTGEILPEQLEYATTYYWKVVPTTTAPDMRADAENVTVWQFTTLLTNPNPQIATNPSPENRAEGITLGLDRVSWDYIASPVYMNPVGFRVYLNTTGGFGSNAPYLWIDYVEDQVTFTSIEIVPDNLDPNRTYYWRVIPTTIYPDDKNAISTRDDAENIPTWRFTTGTTNIDESITEPLITSLCLNYPNPFNPSTTISYSLKEKTNVELVIYNIHGQIVKSLVSEKQTEGLYNINWDGVDKRNHNVSSGVYFYRLKTDHYDSTKKMILMK